MIPSISALKRQIQSPSKTTRLVTGKHDATLGRLSYDSRNQTLYVNLNVDGHKVEPVPSIVFDAESPFAAQNLERYEAFLEAVGLHEYDLKTMLAGAKANGSAKQVHVTELVGTPITLVVKSMAANATKGTKAFVLYTFEAAK